MVRPQYRRRPRRATAGRTPKVRLYLECLEERTLLSSGEWLAVISGISPADNLADQAQAGQDLLVNSGVSPQTVQVVSALDLSGTFRLQTATTVDQPTLTAELQGVPGFVFAQEDQPDGPGVPTNAGPDGDPNSGDPSNQSGPVASDPSLADPLVNNNAGSTGTSNFTQSTSSLVAFGNTVVVGFNDSGSAAGGANKFTGFARSTDGGNTFTDGGTLPTSTIGDKGGPVLAQNNTTGRIYMATNGSSFPSTIQVFRSDDSGTTWQTPVNGTPGGNTENRPWIAVDNFAGTGNGNVYLLSRRFGGSAPGIYFFRSTDNGNTFGPNGGTLMVQNDQGAYLVVGPDHSIDAFWWAGSTLQMRKSTDLGQTFGAPVTVASGLSGNSSNNGDLSLVGQNNGETISRPIRTDSFPRTAVNPVSGQLYVTYNNKGTGTDKADIFLVTSSDGGAHWSSPVKVNDDTTTTDQWAPAISVTPDGSKLGIFYYSRQVDTTTTDGDPVDNQFQYFGRVGTISGSTISFGTSFAVSPTESKPEVARDSAVSDTSYMGDYNQTVTTPGFFNVTWSDNRSPLPGGGSRQDPNVTSRRSRSRRSSCTSRARRRPPAAPSPSRCFPLPSTSATRSSRPPCRRATSRSTGSRPRPRRTRRAARRSRSITPSLRR
jgi:hypothetical protein